jgi:energy-coupling factor transporter ATP-binding protein EcfA2
VRFRRLEVRAYRAIDHAELEFGPGLNVLYGPNDLGKSTLAAAMRAALLLPAESTAHQSFVPWHGVGPPRVQLTFERDGVTYRVTKIFGSGSLGSALLESSPDGSSFQEEERGRAVDRRLRELLRWGIEAPGGKGGARGLPESFLSHVLLGNQSDVPLILERSLQADRDGSGRERLHEALQALSQDPVFKRVLEAAQAKVDAAFTPTGRRRTGQNTPFAPLKEQITTLAQELERLTHQRRESEDVQQRLSSLNEARSQCEAQRRVLEQQIEREAELIAQLARREQAVARLGRAEQARAARQAERAELEALEAELATARARAEAGQRDVAAAASCLAEAEARAATAERAAAESMSESALAQRSRRRAELEAAAQQKRIEQEALLRLLALSSELAAAEAALAAGSKVLAAAESAEAAARRELATVEAELAELRELDAVASWQEAASAAERARVSDEDARKLLAEAQALRARAAAEPVSEALAAVSPAAFAELRALRDRIRLAAARLDVGLSLTLRLPAGQALRASLDGGPEQRLDTREQPIVQHAKSRITATLEDGVELEATAGDPHEREQLAALEGRWASEALPLLRACGAQDLDALATQLEATRARQRQVAEWLREAASTAARAAEKRELAGDLEQLEQRVTERRQALAHLDAGQLDARLAAVRPRGVAGARPAPGGRGAEPSLERRRVRAAAERERLDAELQRQVAARIGGLARRQGLAEARDALLARRAEAWAAQAGEAPLPGDAALRERHAAVSAASAAAGAELERWQHEQDRNAAAARREREEAARALADARQRLDRAQALSRDVRERVLTLEAQSKERRSRFDPATDIAAQRELAAAQAELDALGEVEAVSAERHAASRAELERVSAELERTLAELRRAEGALGHVGGDVVTMRQQQTEEALERARVLELDQEREYDAYRLLLETLRDVENEQGVHLGKALEAPVSERFERLTEGRYRQVGLDGGLSLAGVAVAGRPRAYGELSEGTQEQLATILRLCIAEYLQTALVLDDHLAQTHRQRAEWFRTTLREAAERIQIVVLTARPEDYLDPGELSGAAIALDSVGQRVRATDLERIISRAQYGVLH